MEEKSRTLLLNAAEKLGHAVKLIWVFSTPRLLEEIGASAKKETTAYIDYISEWIRSVDALSKKLTTELNSGESVADGTMRSVREALSALYNGDMESPETSMKLGYEMEQTVIDTRYAIAVETRQKMITDRKVAEDDHDAALEARTHHIVGDDNPYYGDSELIIAIICSHPVLSYAAESLRRLYRVIPENGQQEQRRMRQEIFDIVENSIKALGNEIYPEKNNGAGIMEIDSPYSDNAWVRRILLRLYNPAFGEVDQTPMQIARHIHEICRKAALSFCDAYVGIKRYVQTESSKRSVSVSCIMDLCTFLGASAGVTRESRKLSADILSRLKSNQDLRAAAEFAERRMYPYAAAQRGENPQHDFAFIVFMHVQMNASGWERTTDGKSEYFDLVAGSKTPAKGSAAHVVSCYQSLFERAVEHILAVIRRTAFPEAP